MRIYLTAILFISFACEFILAQDFPGKHPELLLNKKVKPIAIKPELQTYHYKNFYSKFDTDTRVLEKYNKRHRAFPRGSSTSDYDKLFGVEFLVTNIYNENRKYNSDESRYFVLELKNEEMGTLFYSYDGGFEYDYELEVVGGLEIPSEFYCSDITSTTDKFTDKVSYQSPYSDGITFLRTVENGTTYTYMGINQPGHTINVGKKGLIILFESGDKLERPEEEIDAKVSSSGTGYVYSAFIQLTPNEMILLSEQVMTDKRLYIYDGTIEHGEKLRQYISCILKK